MIGEEPLYVFGLGVAELVASLGERSGLWGEIMTFGDMAKGIVGPHQREIGLRLAAETGTIQGGSWDMSTASTPAPGAISNPRSPWLPRRAPLTGGWNFLRVWCIHRFRDKTSGGRTL